MALVPVFKALITPDGQLLLRETERARRRQWLQTLAGQNVEVIVRPIPKQRSLDVNRYLHAVPFEILMEHTGHTLEEVKRICLAARFGSIGVDEHGLPIPVIEHTSSLDSEQGSSLIEFLPPWALHEFDGKVQIPLPGEVEWRL